jgi:SAM-dependent methyltransferase
MSHPAVIEPTTAPNAVYARALETRSLVARAADGRRLPTCVDRWLRPAGPADERAIARAHAPVLDVGCGPGRHVAALASRGVPALGIDISAAAVRLARRRGVPALRSSIFAADVPWAGRWGGALLLDGNVGIGGDAATLLRRVGELLRGDGRMVVELEPPGTPSGRFRVRLETGDAVSTLFPWARVAADDLGSVAREARCGVVETWEDDERHFAVLTPERAA